MDQLSELLKKCYKHNLHFTLFNNHNRSVDIYDSSKNKSVKITEGHTKNWDYESYDDTINRMHREVDEYIRQKHEKFVDELIEEVGEWKA